MFAASIQGEGVLAKSKSQSGLGTMQACFSVGEPMHGHGSCVPDLAFHWPFQVGAGPTPRRMVSYTYCWATNLQNFFILQTETLYLLNTKSPSLPFLSPPLFCFLSL